MLVKFKVKNEIKKLEKRYDISIHYQKISFTSYSVLSIEELSLIGNHSPDTLLSMKAFQAKVRYFNNHWFKIGIKDIQLDQLFINIVQKENYSNYSLEKRSEKRSKVEKINRFLAVFKDYFPQHLSSNTILIRSQLDSVETSLRIDSIMIADKKLQGNGFMTSNRFLSSAQVDFLLDLNDLSKEVNGLYCNAKVRNCKVEDPKIWKTAVTFDSIGLALHIKVDEHRIEVDSTSLLQLNDFAVHPYACWEEHNNKRLLIRFNERDLSVEKFTKAVPKGVFSVIPDLNVKGNVHFSLLFDCNFNQIDSLQFDFNIQKSSFYLAGQTGAYFTKYNYPFDYQVYENGKIIRTIRIGSENSNFCPFTKIPRELTNSLLISEDPSFFQHRGILVSAIRASMITN
ncbi:MAG: hypothetical protein RR034_06350, partial [Bacteroidales bacterium]